MQTIAAAHKLISLHLTARRLRVSPTALSQWSEVGAGPMPDERGVYRGEDVAKWIVESAAAGTP